jgi:hypothetical protein
VWLLARTLHAPSAGGHYWAYLNWALGLQALGCRVVWLEVAPEMKQVEKLRARVRDLRTRLRSLGLEHLAVVSRGRDPLPADVTRGCLTLDAAEQADLLIDAAYGPAEVVGRFRRSALLDIDPGLLQHWVKLGGIELPPHDVYFTIGETVGRPGSGIPDCGLRWQHIPPCVALDWWPVREAPADAPFTTVTSWIQYDYWVDDESGGYANDKRSGFLPFLDVPARTSQSLELSLMLGGADEERTALESRGWRVRDAEQTAGTPRDYQRYIQGSRGEFSCAKPSCVRFRNAWVSDRTLCYLASGKPAVVQHTGPSALLPDADGLFRFSTPDQAVRHLETIAADYAHHSARARALAEEHFDARKVASQLFEQALFLGSAA